MRLTLRTMLAYLDNILDPEDAQVLKQKIDESEFAESLVHRVRSSVRRPRLEAPRVDAVGLGVDANSVAEYLDSTLAPESMRDFEQVCLESDTHLGEVASCHQILTLVLGEPAEVGGDLRQRIYRVGVPTPDLQTVPPHAPTSVAVASPPRVESTLQPIKHRKREQQRQEQSAGPWWKPVVMMALMGFVLLTAAVFAMGPLDATHPLAGLLGLQVAENSTKNEQAVVDDSQQRLDLIPPSFGPPSVETQAGDTHLDATDSAVDASNDITSSPSELAGDEVNTDTYIETSDRQTEPAVEDVDPTVDGVFDPTNELVESSDELPAGATDVLQVPNPNELPFDDTPDDIAFDPTDDEFTKQGDWETEPIDDVRPQALASESGHDQPGFAPNVRPANLEDEAADEIGGTPAIDPNATAGPKRDQALPDILPARPIETDPLLAEGQRPEPVLEVTAADAGEPPLAAVANNVSRTPLPEDPATNVSAPAVEPAETVSPDEGPAAFGRLMTPAEILVKHDPQLNRWSRVALSDVIEADTHLLALPVYRPHIMLAPGIQIVVQGAARFHTGLTEDGAPLVGIDYGRVILNPVDEDRPVVTVVTPNGRAAIEFGDKDSKVAVEVRRLLEPGLPPEHQTAHRLVQVYCVSGSARWNVENGSPLALQPGQRWTAVDDITPRVADNVEMPAWIDGRKVRSGAYQPNDGLVAGTDLLAAKTLAKSLTDDRPIELVLRERLHYRRTEVKALAARCLAHLGHIDPLLAALNDRTQHPFWSSEFDELQLVMATNPDAPLQIRSSIEKIHHEEGVQLYGLLWGVTPESLAKGMDATLVKFLNDESLDFRVVAFENLKRITGFNLLYRPDYTEMKRKTHVLRWHQRLKRGEIRYKELPEITQLLSQK